MQPLRLLAGLVCLLTTAALSSSAHAQTCERGTFQTSVTFTGTFGPQPPPWSGQTISVPKFTPGPGETLLKAEITAKGTITGSVQAENLSTSGGHLLQWSLGSALQVINPVPAQPPLVLVPTITGQNSLATYDGNIDFGGASGASNFGLSADASQSATFTDPAVLTGVFTGPGNLTFVHNANDGSTHNGGGNLVIVLLNQTRVDVTVKYTFCTPVPPDVCEERNRRNCGSLLLYPEFDNRLAKLTLVTITSACCDDDPSGSWVEFRFINKDNCLEANFSRQMTPCDTFSFLTSSLNPNQAQGYMYAYAKTPPNGDPTNPSGTPQVYNRLIGQLLMIDGIEAVDYSLNAVSFRGIGEEFEPNDDDDDGIRDLNGPKSATPEYEEAPDQILIPRFLGQDQSFSATALYQSELILIALSGGAQFTTTIDVLGYNDNEDPLSSQYSFQCWAKPKLAEVAPFTLESYLDSLPTNSPNEILGASTRESGWLRLDGLVANSFGPETIQDPAIYAVLIERFGGYAAADLPFEWCSQTNGDLLPVSNFGDGPKPVPGDNQ